MGSRFCHQSPLARLLLPSTVVSERDHRLTIEGVQTIICHAISETCKICSRVYARHRSAAATFVAVTCVQFGLLRSSRGTSLKVECCTPGGGPWMRIASKEQHAIWVERCRKALAALRVTSKPQPKA